MKTIHLSYPHQLKREELPETSTAIGFFDGVHQGHKKVIDEAIKEAKKKSLQSAVITFYPHPSVVLKKDAAHTRYITPLAEKEEILEKMGVDRLYIVEFNKNLSRLSPEEFVDHFLINLNIRHVVTGFDFTFGHKGKGNMNDFPRYTKEPLSFTVIEKVEEEGEKVSSTKIRQCMDDGDIAQANQLLGRPLMIRGKVITGDKRGRTIGYPTANLDISEDYYLPKVGVYAVKVVIEDQKWNGMANLGFKPTFQEKQIRPTLEVHLLDFQGDLYGKTVKVEWHTFIRNEKKFNGIDELLANLKRDEQEVRSLF